jgi:hypothetical protein
LLVSLSAGGVLECLACGYENKQADKFCAQCASSLHLKLCSVCEAVNANNDASCYKCGAESWAAPQVPLPVEDASIRESQSDRISRVFALSASRRLASLFAVPIMLLAGTVAFFDATTFSSGTEAPSIPGPQVQEARTEPSDTTTGVPSGSVAPATPAAVVLERPLSSVTHTRASPAAPTDAAPTKQMPTKQKRVGVASVRAALVGEPSSKKVEEPAVAPASMLAAPAYSRVTHTKVQQPARTAARTQKLDAGEEQAAGCAPSVAALGLCTNK